MRTCHFDSDNLPVIFSSVGLEYHDIQFHFEDPGGIVIHQRHVCELTRNGMTRLFQLTLFWQPVNQLWSLKQGNGSAADQGLGRLLTLMEQN